MITASSYKKTPSACMITASSYKKTPSACMIAAFSYKKKPSACMIAAFSYKKKPPACMITAFSYKKTPSACMITAFSYKKKPPSLIERNAPFRGLGGTTFVIPQPYVLANIYNRRTPYSIQYLLNVERELGGDTALELGYMGSVSRRLESLRAFNEAYPTADPTLSVASRSPYPELGRFQEVDGSGKANYNAFSVKLQRRFSKGLTYLFGYTWSKSIDYGSAIRVHDTDVLFPQSSFNLRAERGLSSFNQDHRAVTSVLYDLPIGKGRRFLGDGGIADAIIGGWQLGSIFTVGGGFPATVIDTRDQSNTGLAYDRANATAQYAVPPPAARKPPTRGQPAPLAP